MNKANLIAAIAKDSGLTIEEAEKALNAVTSNISKSLDKSDKVTLVGFGTFSTSARLVGGRPKKGQPISITATKSQKSSSAKSEKSKRQTA